MRRTSVDVPYVARGLSIILFFLFCTITARGKGSAEDLQRFSTTVVPREEALRLGEQMYRSGILPSGEPMQALVKGDVSVVGTAFACSSCHMRGGLGSIEGLVITPPTNGATLYKPITHRYKGVAVSSAPLRRPAYTDYTLAEVLRSGIDPAGRTLNDVMPRYMLGDEDMAILIAYLRSLSSEFSPGATGTTLRFATVVSDDIRQEDRDAMVGTLKDFFRFRNTTAKAYGAETKKARMTEVLLGSREATYLDLTLSVWEIKGPPETWRSQLEEFYGREPVFALVGGMVSSEWKPIHDFSEAHQLPALFPLTDIPVVTETDWYTLYISKGYHQEGETAARYLNSTAAARKGGPVVQLVRPSREGRALSAAFLETWQGMGNPAPLTMVLKEGETLSANLIRSVVKGEKPSVLVVWDGPDAVPGLKALAANASVEMLVVSGRYMGKSIWSLPDAVRDVLYLTYPFRLPRDEERYRFNLPYMVTREVKGASPTTVKQTYSLIQILSQALIDLRGNYYRDNLLDVISMAPDFQGPLYERLSFGPGQHYASKGCYIVQLSRGSLQELVRKSEWVIH